MTELIAICSLSSGASYPSPLDENPENSGEVARCSDPVGISDNIIPRASSISFKDLASDSLSGRTASTTSWFIIAARSDPPGYKIASSWIKIDGISGL